MENNMYENRWSPFDPKWYQKAFDKFINIADQLFNQNLIIEEGYHIPDHDGSRSSVFRNDAVLNNSFNENLLRETLKDIYFNSTHKLVASNHDNTHFFQWNGYMSDMSLISNTSYCQFTIPTDTFIYPNERDSYKLSQFYRKWIKVEDILSNWNIFKWHCMLFIDQKIYSEYELRIDDHEVTIKFKYNDYWIKNNCPVYIYKFDTNAQCRVLISRELCANQWNWKMPVSHINDTRIANAKNIMVAINKISDPNIRKDGLSRIEVLGDNLEFLKIEDGFIDLTKLSNFNKNYILSESTEWLWMTIVIPKFFHEYPILLPTDVVYRPYEANFQPVVTINHELVNRVKSKFRSTGESRQVYVDMNGALENTYDGWKQMIRPIVLSDAFDESYVEPYESLVAEIDNLRDLTVKGADIIENFRFFLQEYTNEEDFKKYIDDLKNIIYSIREVHNAFLDMRLIEYNQIYESQYKKFLEIMRDVERDGIESEWFNEVSLNSEDEYNEDDFWFMVSPLIHIPRELADKYHIINIIDGMSNNNKVLWDNMSENLNQLRFQRPIESQNFWTFEYYQDDDVWRPYPLQMTRHFPDVYLPVDPTEEVPALNRLFKTFFFYSDTMNVLNQSSDIIRATPTWDEDIKEYHFDQQGIYRDIFMEKFYWMGVRSIYKGLLSTHNRWEVVEYVIDNSSYERFNELFLKTMDPYFKLGLATFLKSENYEFPFDDAINKIQESINTTWLGYKKVTNFEMYLNKTWIPSYFDYVTKIMDDYDYSGRLLRRPRSTFDITRLLPILIKVEEDVFNFMKYLNNNIDWLISKLREEDYNLNINNLIDLKALIQETYDNIDFIYNFTKNLDMDIYSIDDINTIIDRMKKHIDLVDKITHMIDNIYQDTIAHNIYEDKRSLVNEMSIFIINELPSHITKISALIQDFDMEGFMRSINDLRSYFDHNKTNPDDNSLIGYINKFNDPWSVKVKEYRNKLFQSSSILYGSYEPAKSYSVEEVSEFVELVDTVKNDIKNLRDTVSEYWTKLGYEHDEIIDDKLNYTEDLLSNLIINVSKYMDAREGLIDEFNNIKSVLEKLSKYDISDTEINYIKEIEIGMDNMLAALSYIAGKNNRDDALIALDHIKKYLAKWVEFINIEEEVFLKLIELTGPPVSLLDTLKSNQEIIESMISYMDTVNIQFIPDDQWPTYSDIYSIDEIELITGGFNHVIGDIIYIANIGSYKITDVSGNVSIASNIEKMNYRHTTFRNPMWQNYPYDSITNGIGLGITIIPKSVSHERIINDEIVNQIIMKCQNTIYLIKRDINTPNPHNNIDLEYTIKTIGSIKTSWDDIKSVYSDYMSNNVITYIDDMISVLTEGIPLYENFMEIRSGINLNELLIQLEKFIYDSYDYTDKVNKQNENFFYYDNMIRVSYNNLYNFNNTGTSWSDSNILKSILDEVLSVIKLYRTHVLEIIDQTDEVDDLYNLQLSIENIISDAKNTLHQLPLLLIDINPVIRKVENKLENVPSLHKDIWYKIKNIGIAINGSDYKVGDIVELIPQTSEESENIMNDIITNDSILLQITKVENGSVTRVQPLINYALPYQLWGLYETSTKVGNGTGLKVDMYSYEIELSDSTILHDDKSDISKLPQFDENDLFMFKFENIHDLNIKYEVFLGGKQITNFFHRHETSNDPLHPKNVDVLYIKANDVMGLQNSSIFIPAENYFIYRLDNIEIKDPGAGYAVGQEIYVDSEQIALRLKIASLVYGPYKGIAEVDVANDTILYEKVNPTSKDAKVATDSLNNIDDEYNIGYYDKLTQNGISKAATRTFDQSEYEFTSHRFDNLEDGDRNRTFMYPDVNMPLVEDAATNGDPDYHWYQGSRIDNSQHPMSDERIWNGIMNLNPPTDPFIPDDRRLPPGKPIKGEYQLIARERFHNSIGEENDNVNIQFESSIKNNAMIDVDLSVQTFADLPRHTKDFPDGAPGKTVVVEYDETNNGHRMLYRIRTFVAAGFFVYELPEVADYKWNSININWMDCDWYPDYPTMKAQYPTAPWRTSKSYRLIQNEISDKKHNKEHEELLNNTTTYIHDLTVDDLSVFNWTTKKWEDLHDENRWKLEVSNDDENQEWGFTLTLLEEGIYSYDMMIYLNKIPETQMKNANLKRDAIMDITAVIHKEVNKAAINTSVNTGRHLRIRKLFPYEQKETFTIGKSIEGDPLGYEMDFKLAPYIHFKNEIHLEDIKVFNKSAGRFENIMDRRLFEVRFKDPKAVSRGYETQTRILQSLIGNPGEGFVDGEVWAWNEEYGIHVFGRVTADFYTDGHLLTFEPIHCPNPPKESISLEFSVYQHVSQSKIQMAVVMIEFLTEKIEVYGDGYIHNVRNRLAPVPEEFKVIVQYDLDGPQEYDIIISKTSNTWIFVKPETTITPIFHIDNYNIQSDRLYVLTENGRLPLINPSTNKPTLHVVENGDGTDVTFLNIYKRYEHLHICSVPYPMRSVYVQRRIPSNGFIDLKGKINKPLNKKYFEFWVNGKLLYDEVTIITPTKIFLHGLKSLKNLEIIEINRDSNEYFSDEFLSVQQNDLGRPYAIWDYRTYLDDALEGTLENDNYTEEEQEYLLTPVWKQVEQNHPEFKNYPPNVDIEDDILLRVNLSDDLNALDYTNYQFMIIDAPTLEGRPIVERTLTFEHFGFIPISDNMIVDMLNEEWKEEIQSNPNIIEHSIITDDEWYGMATRLYDEYGILVHNLNEAAYHITDSNLLRINISSKLSRIVKNHITYDLT